jgi:hypothetical protein
MQITRDECCYKELINPNAPVAYAPGSLEPIVLE